MAAFDKDLLVKEITMSLLELRACPHFLFLVGIPPMFHQEE